MKNIFSAVALFLCFAFMPQAHAQYTITPNDTAIFENYCVTPVSCQQIVIFYVDTGYVGSMLAVGHVSGPNQVLSDAVIDGPYDNSTWPATIAADGGMGAYLIMMMPDVNAALARMYTAPNYVAVQNSDTWNPPRMNIALQEYFIFDNSGAAPAIKVQYGYKPKPNPLPLP